MIFLGRGGEGWYLFLRAINKANEGGPRFFLAGEAGGGDSKIIQHVIVEMACRKNSVLREKKVTLHLTIPEIGFEVQVSMKKEMIYTSHELLTKKPFTNIVL